MSRDSMMKFLQEKGWKIEGKVYCSKTKKSGVIVTQSIEQAYIDEKREESFKQMFEGNGGICF